MRPLLYVFGALLFLLANSGWADNNNTFRVSPGYEYLVDQSGRLTLRDVFAADVEWEKESVSGAVQQGYMTET
nr:hypothetical protein [Gammaproteobacteria bacterium]NIR94840.1 hypothetical protein [Gammaproteobacteria bacterium]